MRSIGRYEIVRELGRGAMGIVYLARDPHLNREVALKICALPDGVTEELARQFHERFLREARAAASLSHPGIVTVFDAGEDPGTHTPYIAMEYIAGRTLKERLERADRPDVAWVAAFGAVLAEALHVAHRAGIVHRDIKPANILIREADGAVKIADFGVARLKSSDLTQSGAALGSPSYMSPEQVRGLDVDGRSDLFTLAVVLYESLCGRRPFKGEDVVSLAFSIVNDTQVPLSRQSHSLPAGLDAFFERALAKNPADRFPDGLAFRDAFARAAGSAAGAVTAPGGDRGMLRTVVDASTVGLGAATRGMGASTPRPGATTQRLPAGAGPKPVAAMPPANRRGRGRTLGIAVALMALLVAGIAIAARAGRGAQAPPGTIAALDQPPPPLPSTTMAATPPAPPPAIALEAPPEKAGTTPGSAPAKKPAWSPREVEPVRQSPARQSPAPPPPAPKPRPVRLAVPSGTELHVALDGGVSSATSQAGDPFTARVTQPVIIGDRVAIPAGSILRGRIGAAEPASRGLGDKAGTITLQFESIATAAGARAPIAASHTAVGATSGGKTTAVIGGSAAGGALLGRVLGHRSKKSTVAGAIVGAAAGTAAAARMHGEEIELPAGSALIVTLSQPLAIDLAR